jgi:hypothetical protein
MPTQSAGTHDELVSRGKQLRADIDAKYKDLKSKKAFARENDVTSIVLKYVSPSMSIEDVTSVLLSAGFGEPGFTTRGHMFFVKNIGGFGFLTFYRCAVDITPQSRDDFNVIKDVSGSLFSVDF